MYAACETAGTTALHRSWVGPSCLASQTRRMEATMINTWRRAPSSSWAKGVRAGMVLQLGPPPFSPSRAVPKCLSPPVVQASAAGTRRRRRAGEERRGSRGLRVVARGSYRWSDEEVVGPGSSADRGERFKHAAELFNEGHFYACHDVLEELWQQAQEPQRGVIHGLLQCAVGMHHLLNHNHQGAMMEFGEGLNKLRRYSTFHQPKDNQHWVFTFEQGATQVLEFIYNTQLEHAACDEDVCVTMDGSSESYELLGNYGAGKAMYRVAQAMPLESGEVFLEFMASSSAQSGMVPLQTVRVPRLDPAIADISNLSW